MISPRHSRGPVSLGELFDQALQHMPPPPTMAAAPPAPSDGFIFSGNRHDSVPRALLLDNRLTPLERNAWQVFRLLLNDDGVTAFPTYDQLAPWLASIPCTARASHETVARTLTLLRLTRWISLVRRRRDPKTGRMLGNLYVLHDEPLTPYEAIQLDADYLRLVSRSLAHASKSIQRVGVHVLKEMAEDPLLSGQLLPTRLQVLSQRLAAQGWVQTATYPQPGDAHNSEEGPESLLRNQPRPTSESEAGEKPSKSGSLRNPKTDSTVRKEKEIKEVRTVPRTHELGMLRCHSKQSSNQAHSPPYSPWIRSCIRLSSTNGMPAAKPARYTIPPGTCSASSRKPCVASSAPGLGRRLPASRQHQSRPPRNHRHLRTPPWHWSISPACGH